MPIVVWASWAIALTIGIILTGILDSACPHNQVVSGHHCAAPWYPATVEAVMSLGAALAAILIMLSATFTAPSEKIAVARIILVLGVVAAAGFGIALQAWAPAGCAILSGTLTFAMLKRRLAASAHTGGIDS